MGRAISNSILFHGYSICKWNLKQVKRMHAFVFWISRRCSCVFFLPDLLRYYTDLYQILAPFFRWKSVNLIKDLSLWSRSHQNDSCLRWLSNCCMVGFCFFNILNKNTWKSYHTASPGPLPRFRGPMLYNIHTNNLQSVIWPWVAESRL